MPVDGLVVGGKSHADESMLTGEAEPVLKTEGDAVIGGTMNLGGTVQVNSAACDAQTSSGEESARAAPVGASSHHPAFWCLSPLAVPVSSLCTCCKW